MLTPGEVRTLLSEHGLAPHKYLGQNFVTDPNTVRKVVRDAEIAAGDLVVEVGPGLGSLTLALREAGARVTAVEIDAGLVRALRDVLADDEEVRVIHADAMDVDFAELTAGGPAAFVANLPYNVATPILMTALRAQVFDRFLVMVQREVGERWAASVGDPLYGAVSVKIAAVAAATPAAKVSRKAFYPVPNVDSVTIRLRARSQPLVPDIERFFALVDAGFGQRRKRLRNTLGAAGHAPAAVEAALEAIDLTPAARAEELDVETWARLDAELA